MAEKPKGINVQDALTIIGGSYHDLDICIKTNFRKSNILSVKWSVPSGDLYQIVSASLPGKAR